MESALTKRCNNNQTMIATETSCVVRFALDIIQYVGSSIDLRTVCSSVQKCMAQNSTVLRVLPYLPTDRSYLQGQTTIINMLTNHPRVTTVDISDMLISDEYTSFGWFIYKKFPRLDEILVTGKCNAIITTSDITDYYASFRPMRFLTKETIIEVLLVALYQEDYTTLQNFCNSPMTHGRLCQFANNADSFICTYIEEEAEGRNTCECCIHVKDCQDYYRLTLIKNDDVWTVGEVENPYHIICDKCAI